MFTAFKSLPPMRLPPSRFFRALPLAILVLAGGLAQISVFAQTPPTVPASLRVGLVIGDPFVMDNHGLPSGFAIDLWTQIATLNKWTYDYAAPDPANKTVLYYPDIQAGLDAVAASQCDVLVSDTSITSDRLKVLDFSQPYFRSGLQIMITNDRPHTLRWMLESLREILFLKAVWISLIVVVVLSALVARFERKHNPSFPKERTEGLAEAFYYVVSLALTGKSVYKGFPGALGKIASVVWMVAGMLTVAYVTSSITTKMTVERIEGQISGPEDLPGKHIGVLTGTTSETYAQDHKLNYRGYPDLKSAVDDLVAGKLAGIVGDAPQLEYYDSSHPELPITEVGPFFEPQNYGFAVQKGDPRRYQIDEALALLVERGRIVQLGKEYFGNVYVP
jgi:ABC-type amino acid transport substrate-binding protein